MAGRNRSYTGIRFPPAVVARAYEIWKRHASQAGTISTGYNEIVLANGDTESVDSFPSFLEANRCEPPACTFSSYTSPTMVGEFWYYYDPQNGSTVRIKLPNAEAVDEVMAFLESRVPSHQLPGTEVNAQPSVSRQSPHVFIGHGGQSRVWGDLRDFLR